MAISLLKTLQYPGWESANISDGSNFKSIVLWLEENKIKKMNTQTLAQLKNINNPEWFDVFNKYLLDFQCPVSNNEERLRWLLGRAIEKQYQENSKLYNTINNLEKNAAPTVVTENPLDALDFRSKDFEVGILSIAQLLSITPHPDPLITLRACKKVIAARLSGQALQNPKEHVKNGTPFPIAEIPSGFKIEDPILNEATKIMRLSYIHDLRDLQTSVNELIVAVQNVTANPKTDTRLGKVGV